MDFFNKNIPNELVAIADRELDRIKNNIPDDPCYCCVLLMEATRMCDCLNFGSKEEIEKYNLTIPEIDIIKSGWNLAASFLLKSMENFPGVPIMESTMDLRTSATSLLYHFGCIVVLKRSAEMLKTGILIADSKDGNTYKFSMSIEGKAQFLDHLELLHFENLKNKVNQNEESYYKKWELIDYADIDRIFHNYGNFLSKSPKAPFPNLNLEDLEAKMYPLIKSWDSGNGIMLGYDSTEEIDLHFMAIAAEIIRDCRDDAGIHPDLIIEDIKTSDIMIVTMCLVSFNLKHIEFLSIAAKKRKEILIFPSFLRWGPLSGLINEISDYTRIRRDIVEKIFKIISLRFEDLTLLRNHTTKFMPLIIDLGNGFILHPVSSILRNPLNTIKDLMILRKPELISDFSKGREPWLRYYLYALFSGNRYNKIEGNINLRIDKKFITDIDAAIYDNVTGELALFQIKWQDYHLNDVKKIVSKASNLTEELDKWTRKVSEWISSQGISQLLKTLRLTDKKKITESKIYLFGLSKNAARMKGYGFELKEKKIAIGTWAQFKRNRTEIGPSKSVFGDLFIALKEQENSDVKSTPMPVTFKISDKEFYYSDMWNIFENETDTTL